MLTRDLRYIRPVRQICEPGPWIKRRLLLKMYIALETILKSKYTYFYEYTEVGNTYNTKLGKYVN